MRRGRFLLILALAVTGFFVLDVAEGWQREAEACTKMLNRQIPMPEFLRGLLTISLTRAQNMVRWLSTIGTFSVISAVCLCFLDLRKPKPKPVIAMLLLLSATLFVVPQVNAREASPDPEKWYANLTLQEPRNITGVLTYIYYYDNLVCYYPYAWVAHNMFIIRYNEPEQKLETIEVGYFQNRTGWWLYAARKTVTEGYVESAWRLQDYIGANGTSGRPYYIWQWDGPDVYSAWAGHESSSSAMSVHLPASIEELSSGADLLMTVTFTVSGLNLGWAGIESDYDHNQGKGHQLGLHYHDGVWRKWVNVQAFADPPYTIEVVGTNEFYTYGGYDICDINHDGCVNYIDLFLFRKAYTGEYNIDCDFNFDGVVDYRDLFIFQQHYLIP